MMRETAIRRLAETLRGVLLRPGDDAYEVARSVWNASIDRRPALIARCTGTADVVAAVEFARDEELVVAVRGGGHNVAGNAVCDDGLVIDLSTMKGIRVDPLARTARAQGGLTWGDVDHETQTFGLATTGGLVSSTGIAGFTLGGGIGWLGRKYGLACDNLISADVVAADGRHLIASPTQHPDLLWALRGGGGNFGVVTSFEYQLHAVAPPVLAGLVFHPIERGAELLRFYRDFVAGAPDELSAYVVLRVAPPAPFLPEHVHGTAVVAIAVCYAGPLEEGEELVRPLRSFGRPLVDLIRPMPYVAWQAMFDASWEAGFQNYWKSHYLCGLGDGAVDTLLSHLASITSPLSDTKIAHLQGAVSRVGEAQTAFGNRDAPFVLNINTRWSGREESDKHIQWTREFFEAMEPHSTGGVYVNFLGDEGESRVRAAYGEANWERLIGLKKTYDPTNFFRLNQNIKPSNSESPPRDSMN
jgi:FAD/FMN-containing dehydrogenase